MGRIYGTGEVCLNGTEWSHLIKDGKECLSLEPHLTEIMADSSDYKLRSYVWKVIFSANLFLWKKFIFLMIKRI